MPPIAAHMMACFFTDVAVEKNQTATIIFIIPKIIPIAKNL
jgi:hypothetical protein